MRFRSVDRTTAPFSRLPFSIRHYRIRGFRPDVLQLSSISASAGSIGIVNVIFFAEAAAGVENDFPPPFARRALEKIIRKRAFDEAALSFDSEKKYSARDARCRR